MLVPAGGGVAVASGWFASDAAGAATADGTSAGARPSAAALARLAARIASNRAFFSSESGMRDHLVHHT
jgi:hypothetical protein